MTKPNHYIAAPRPNNFRYLYLDEKFMWSNEEENIDHKTSQEMWDSNSIDDTEDDAVF